MNEWLFVITMLAAAIAAVAFLYERWNLKRTFDTLESMLQAAINGDFSESQFDESRLSKTEAIFARYLNASAVSAKATAREKDKIKTLIADISHQTKTPIANLMLYSELLQESDLADDQRESANAIHQQTAKLQFLIESLVKLSRLDNGIIQLSPHREHVMRSCRQFMMKCFQKHVQKSLRLF